MNILDLENLRRVSFLTINVLLVTPISLLAVQMNTISVATSVSMSVGPSTIIEGSEREREYYEGVMLPCIGISRMFRL